MLYNQKKVQFGDEINGVFLGFFNALEDQSVAD